MRCCVESLAAVSRGHTSRRRAPVGQQMVVCAVCVCARCPCTKHYQRPTIAHLYVLNMLGQSGAASQSANALRSIGTRTVVWRAGAHSRQPPSSSIPILSSSTMLSARMTGTQGFPRTHKVNYLWVPPSQAFSATPLVYTRASRGGRGPRGEDSALTKTLI